MPQNDGDKLNRIEELKSKLFSKNYQSKIQHREKFTHFKKADIPDVWEDQSTSAASGSPNHFLVKTSIFKNFFILSVVFFVLAVGYASYVFFAGGNTVSNDNIAMSIQGNDFVAGGEELSFIVGITNRNSSALELVDLIMEYPKVASSDSSPGLSSGMERLRESLGTIPAGAVRNENLKVTLFGEQGSTVPIKISIEYRVEGSNAIFVKDKNYVVAISSTPLNLSIDGPSYISPNQDITFNIKEMLNATQPAPKMLLRVDYPVGFQFKSAVPAPTLSNNIWSLGDLAPGVERTISVTGKMIDVVDGEKKSFHVSSGAQSRGDKSIIDVVFNSITHTVEIKRPFIEAELSINGVSGRAFTTHTKTQITGQIKWTNNLDTKVNDLSIKAKIYGNAVDRKTIMTNSGFYSSLGGTNVVIWDKNYQNRLSEVAPGDSGTVDFSLSPLALFSAADGILSDPTISIDISISGKQLVSGYATADLANNDSGTIHIISDVGFSTKALYYSGPFTNTGPVPPKVEKQTTYTVVWSLSNTANNISKGVVRSSLPPWIKFSGPISPSGEDLTYNPLTREIVWNIGSIPKGTGITKPDRAVSFQVSFTPSLSQARTTPVIVNDSVLTGHDDFANVDVKVGKPSIRTSLDSDSAFPSDGGTVVE